MVISNAHFAHTLKKLKLHYRYELLNLKRITGIRIKTKALETDNF